MEISWETMGYPLVIFDTAKWKIIGFWFIIELNRPCSSYIELPEGNCANLDNWDDWVEGME